MEKLIGKGRLKAVVRVKKLGAASLERPLSNGEGTASWNSGRRAIWH
jgi:hypothetical protein